MKKPSPLLVVALLSSLNSGCFIADISKPVSVDGLVERTTPPLHLIPSRDVQFLVQRFPKKLVVTITSKNWQIEGFGVGDLGGGDGSRDLIFDSICGYRKKGGSSDVYTLEVNAGVKVNVFMEDSSGRHLLTKPAEQAVPSDGHKPSCHSSSADPTAPADAH